MQIKHYTNKINVKVFKVQVRAETYWMPERTFGIQAVTIQPVPAIPWVKPGIITMAILAFTSLLITERKEYQQHYQIIIDDT